MLTDLHRTGLTDMVTIIINFINVPDETFVIHKAVACYHSRMFEAAFNGPFIEGQSQSITLKELPANWMFGVIQSWMYTGSLDITKDFGGSPGGGKISSLKSNPIMLLQVWVIADRCIIPELQNDVMALMMELTYVPVWIASSFYKNTTPESKLRKWFVERAAADKDTIFAKALQNDRDWVHIELVVDIFKVLETRPGLKRKDLKLDDYLVNVD